LPTAIFATSSNQRRNPTRLRALRVVLIGSLAQNVRIAKQSRAREAVENSCADAAICEADLYSLAGFVYWELADVVRALEYEGGGMQKVEAANAVECTCAVTNFASNQASAHRLGHGLRAVRDVQFGVHFARASLDRDFAPKQF